MYFKIIIDNGKICRQIFGNKMDSRFHIKEQNKNDLFT